MKPLISIILVNYNGLEFLDKLALSLNKQTASNFEVIFVDNASTDQSATYFRNIYPSSKIILNRENTGFAHGNNLGVAQSSAEWVLLINTDTFFEKTFLHDLSNIIAELPPYVAAIQPMILSCASGQTQPTLDGCGSFWTKWTFLYHFGYKKSSINNLYHKTRKVFTLKGAAMLIDKSVFNKVGGLDDDFWCYYEETDLCHRLWLFGYECLYYPKTIIYHVGGGTSQKFDSVDIQFHNIKNKLMSFLKNFSLYELIRIVPTHMALSLLLFIVLSLRLKKNYLYVLARSWMYVLSNLRKILKKRRLVQKNRKLSDKELNEWISLKVPFREIIRPAERIDDTLYVK